MQKSFAHCLRLLVLLAVQCAATRLAGEASGIAPPEDSTPDRWVRVEELASQGLPLDAVELLARIQKDAMESGSYPAAVRAIGQRINLQAQIEELSSEDRLATLEEEVEEAPPKMKCLMHLLAASWYNGYYQSYRWQILRQSSSNSDAESENQNLGVLEISRQTEFHIQEAMKEERWLKRTPLAAYAEALDAHELEAIELPTLYDLAVTVALDFYDSDIYSVAHPEVQLRITSPPPLLNISEVIRWSTDAELVAARIVRSTTLYRKILDFHLLHNNRKAYAYWALKLLHFGYSRNLYPHDLASYRYALREFARQWPDSVLYSEALFLLAQSWKTSGDLETAQKHAEKGYNAFPESGSGLKCYNLLCKLLKKNLEVFAERVWDKADMTFQVRYRNIDKIHFRMVAADPRKVAVDSMKQERRGWNYMNTEYPGQDLLDELLSTEPAEAWSMDVPAAKYREQRVAQVTVPAGLQPGYYFLLVSHDPKFGKIDNLVLYTPIWISRLALITRPPKGPSANRRGIIEGILVDADSGTPVGNAVVQGWNLKPDQEEASEQPARTDANGLFRFQRANHERGSKYFILAEQGIHQIGSKRGIESSFGHRSSRRGPAFLFTDRAIYRPGQTIHVKGIVTQRTGATPCYLEPAADYETLIILRSWEDNRKIATQTVRTNDYGSFSTSFELPRNILRGNLEIFVPHRLHVKTIRVDDYKRPTFDVSMKAPDKTLCFDQEITVKGQAVAYHGTPVDGADVRWHVMPHSVYRRWIKKGDTTEADKVHIKQGRGTTSRTGTFEFTFTPTMAGPGETSSARSRSARPVLYKAVVEITDTAGETRSTEYLMRIGASNFKVAILLDNWQQENKPVHLSLKTFDLDDTPRPGRGTIMLYRLKNPETVHRKNLPGHRYRPSHERDAQNDLVRIENWESESLLFKKDFSTNNQGIKTGRIRLNAGAYRITVNAQNLAGGTANATREFIVLDLAAKRLDLNLPYLCQIQSPTLSPGQVFRAVWASGYDEARAFIEIEHAGKIIQRYWTPPGITQAIITHPVTNDMRGGFVFRVTMVRENRCYTTAEAISVPWDNKKLQIHWDRFVSRLTPGGQETWTAVVTGPDGDPAPAELVATLYDRSLDALSMQGWWSALTGYRKATASDSSTFHNEYTTTRPLHGEWRQPRALPLSLAPSFLEKIRWYSGQPHIVSRGIWSSERSIKSLSGHPLEKKADEIETTQSLDQVPIRRDLRETAFFMPHLKTDDQGRIEIKFVMPEAITGWRFLGFAHDKTLRSGSLSGMAITAKDLVVKPNPPRILRSGDILGFPVRVINNSARVQSGVVRLNFINALTNGNVDSLLHSRNPVKRFTIPPHESRTYTWPTKVPDTDGLLIYRTTAKSDMFSDGEEGYIPVLPRRIALTESLPLSIRGPAVRRYKLPKLLNSAKLDTLHSKSLTLQLTSNPAWCVIMTLPSLINTPHNCSEQVFNRLYANIIARQLIESEPQTENIFAAWRDDHALQSPLEKNPEVKSILLQETPWLVKAKSDTQRRQAIAAVFEGTKIETSIHRELQSLTDQQLGNGAWPWFKQGRPDKYITAYIVSGFGRLQKLNGKYSKTPAQKALPRIDQWILDEYENCRELVDEERGKNQLTPAIIYYLYARSYFLDSNPVNDPHKPAFDYFLEQGRKYWLEVEQPMLLAHLALVFHRSNHQDVAQQILQTLKERAVKGEHESLHWQVKDRTPNWDWAPIETHAAITEAFSEIADDKKTVTDCTTWLLQQKRTHHWGSSKATSDAVYALLLQGTSLVSQDAPVAAKIGTFVIRPENIKAGSGFYEHTFSAKDISPAMGHVAIKKMNDGLAWGGLHWQYLEDIDKVTPHSETPLNVKKELYIKELSPSGPLLKPHTGPVNVGDELTVRLTVSTDREIEYIHLQDTRPSGTEPSGDLSGPRYRNQLRYYESITDNATHFFISRLPKGTHIIEYSLRIQHRGSYHSGAAVIECMYAPEFNGHSASLKIIAH